MAEWSACLTTNYEVRFDFRHFYNFKCGLDLEDNWVAT